MWPDVILVVTRDACPRMESEPAFLTFVLSSVLKFLLWCILLVVSWPLALLVLVLYPLVWVLLIPFRIVGIAVEGVLGVLRGVVMLPARLVSGR